MSYLTSLHALSGGTGNFSGALFRIDQTFGTKRLYFPPNVGAIHLRPSGDNYGNRHYLVGGHTTNILVDEEFRCHRQGLRAPDTVPSVSVGAGTTSQVCYTRFYDELTGERSPLSEGKAVTGDTNRSWTTLPTEVPSERIVIEGIADIAAGAVTGVGAPAKTNFGNLRPGDRVAKSSDLTRWGQVRSITSNTAMTIDDSGMAGVSVTLVAKPYSRASHVELWVSVSGALPRLAVRVRIGTTSVTESVATLALGQAEVTSFVAMPKGGFSVFFNDRQFVAGVVGHEKSIYASAAGFPERHEGLAFNTTYNEPVVGLLRFPTYILVLCPESSYVIRGYTDDDYVMTSLWPDVGGMGHHGNMVVGSRAYIPGQKTVQIFDGAFHPGIPTRQTEWTTDYLNSVRSFEEGFAVINPNDFTYQFFPLYNQPGITSSNDLKPFKNSVYVAHYDRVGPVAGGAINTPEWLSDTYNTPSGVVTCAAYLIPSETKIGKLYRGDSASRIYEEDESEGVSAAVTSYIVTPHYLFGDPGGYRRQGKQLEGFWSYMVSETNQWEVRIWPGDEYAYPTAPSASHFTFPGQDLAQWRDVVAGSALTDYAPKTVHPHMNLPKVAGRGFTFEYRTLGGRGQKFHGLGGYVGPGEISRRKVTSGGS